jgi:hypothetical protein
MPPRGCSFDSMDPYSREAFYARYEAYVWRMKQCGFGFVQVSEILRGWGFENTNDHLVEYGRKTRFTIEYDHGKLVALGYLPPCKDGFIGCIIRRAFAPDIRHIIINLDRNDRINGFSET